MLVLPGLINNHTHGTAYGPLFPSGHEALPREQVLANLDRHLLEGTTTVLCVDGFVTGEALARTGEAHPVNLRLASCNTPACLEVATVADGGGLTADSLAFTARRAVDAGAVALGEIGAGHTLGGGGASYMYIPAEIESGGDGDRQRRGRHPGHRTPAGPRRTGRARRPGGDRPGGAPSGGDRHDQREDRCPRRPARRLTVTIRGRGEAW